MNTQLPSIIEIYTDITLYFKNIFLIISFLLFINYSAKIQIAVIFIRHKKEKMKCTLFNNILMNKKY